ncbi:MAG: hypothetical protein PHS92_00095 [Candidatus Gracilibacteria bacterium]|nr:hypothetical protein [Candidatus Gracilibacteria bacterium]
MGIENNGTHKQPEHAKKNVRLSKNPKMAEKQSKELEKLGKKRKLLKGVEKAKTIGRKSPLKQQIKQMASNNIKTGDIDNAKFDKMNSDKEYFNRNYSKYNKGVCAWVGLNNNLSVSLIERESTYDIKAKSETLADGYMQLTNDPFEDMYIGKFTKRTGKGKIRKLEGRGTDYVTYFKTLPENLIAPISNKFVQKTLRRMKEMALDEKKMNVSEWNKGIEFLEKNRKEPHLNLIIGNTYLSYLKNQEASDKRIDAQVEKLEKLIKKIGGKNKVSKEKIEKRFKSLLSEKGINVSNGVGELEEFLRKLKNPNNKDLRSSFYALSRYNGQGYNAEDMTEHKIIYAVAVLTAKKGRDIRNIA